MCKEEFIHRQTVPMLEATQYSLSWNIIIIEFDGSIMQFSKSYRYF